MLSQLLVTQWASSNFLHRANNYGGSYAHLQHTAAESLGIYLLGSGLCEVKAKLCGQGDYLLLLILLLAFL